MHQSTLCCSLSQKPPSRLRKNMAMMRSVVCFLTVAAMVMTAADATAYFITWNTGIDYAAWAAGKNFKVGDTILLTYSPVYHSAVQVWQSGYANCSTTSPIFYDNSGATIFTLIGLGKVYIICGSPGHCNRGMKIEVTVTGYPSAAYRISWGGSALAFALLLMLAAI